MSVRNIISTDNLSINSILYSIPLRIRLHGVNRDGVAFQTSRKPDI